MDKKDITKQIQMSYEELTKYLIKKYGPVPYDYFYSVDCRDKDNRNNRTIKEGLFIHHIDEDKAIMLSSDSHAINNPFLYQKADRLVYCNILEHLLLHFKIFIEPRNPQANYKEIPGIGGALNFIVVQINDCFNGYVFKKKYMEIVRSTINDNLDEYLAILGMFLEHYIKTNDKRSAINMIEKLTKASSRSFFIEARDFLMNKIESKKLDRNSFEEIVKNVSLESSSECLKIALFYTDGYIVDYNEAEIIKWCRLALKRSSPQIKYSIAKIYEKLGNMEEQYVETLTSSAEEGCADAQVALGKRLSIYNILSPKPDNWESECKRWLNLAIESGSFKAKQIFAHTLFSNKYSDYDVAKAHKYMIDSAENGDVMAMRTLGHAYFWGELIERDYKKATIYLLMAGDNGDRLSRDFIKRHHIVLLKNLI